MALKTEELRQGIKYWRSKPKWPQDFHNKYYEHELASVRTGKFDQQWWDRFYYVLSDWRATRGVGRVILDLNIQARFAALNKIWTTVIVPRLKDDIASVKWDDIAALPTLAAEIKDVQSPVFTSKFCHLLVPRIFPLVDNEALGNPFSTYQAYFEAARGEWLGTDSQTQDELVQILTGEIGAPLYAGFPMKCRLIELCLIGRHNHC